MDLDHMIALIHHDTPEDDTNDGASSGLPADPALAMAYVPMQTLGETYSEETGWKNGTIFPELNKPFRG